MSPVPLTSAAMLPVEVRALCAALPDQFAASWSVASAVLCAVQPTAAGLAHCAMHTDDPVAQFVWKSHSQMRASLASAVQVDKPFSWCDKCLVSHLHISAAFHSMLVSNAHYPVKETPTPGP